MSTTNMYTPAGWVDGDAILDDPSQFVICTGGRGIGKTFNVLDAILRRRWRFFYCRRVQSQIDAIKLPDLNPFKALNDQLGTDVVVQALGKSLAGFYHSEAVDGVAKAIGNTIGIGGALSTFANLRGIDGSDLDVVLFDEFIKERHERAFVHGDEGLALLNMVETLGRNRELQGRPPLKVILLSNSNDLDSPILQALGALKPLDEMIRRGQSYRQLGAGTVSIRRYLDSPISAKKRTTGLYRAAQDRDFLGMALDNEFSANDYENVGSRPLKEFRPLVTIGDMTVYEHKSDGSFYVVPGKKSEDRYTMLDNDRKAFRRTFWYLYEAMLDRRLTYATAPVKLAFEKIF